MKRIAFTLLLAICLAPASFAQEEAKANEPVFLAVNLNQVAMTDMGELAKMWRENAAPILKEMKEEGMLINYGMMRHAWGDEWNFGFYMVAKDHASFLKAWEHYIKTLNERHPDAGKNWISKIKAHKDNFYWIEQ